MMAIFRLPRNIFPNLFCWFEILLLRKKKTLDTERNILIYGAGEAGAQSSLALMHSDKYQLVGFIDDDISKKNSMINNFKVHHTRDIDAVLKSNKVSDILLSIPSLSFSQKRQIISNLEKFNLNLLIVPDLNEIVSGKVSLTDIKQLDINSLLDRQINVSNYGLSSNFINKTGWINEGPLSFCPQCNVEHIKD